MRMSASGSTRRGRATSCRANAPTPITHPNIGHLQFDKLRAACAALLPIILSVAGTSDPWWVSRILSFKWPSAPEVRAVCLASSRPLSVSLSSGWARRGGIDPRVQGPSVKWDSRVWGGKTQTALKDPPGWGSLLRPLCLVCGWMDVRFAYRPSAKGAFSSSGAAARTKARRHWLFALV